MSADLDRYRANLQAEIDGAALSTALTEIESTSALDAVYQRLAHARTAGQRRASAS